MKVSGANPIRLLAASYIALIGAGTALLMLPVSIPEDSSINFIDALFTATSAACVTGLTVRDTGADFTTFGQTVILALIQLGGIGIMTFSVLVFSLFSGRFSMLSRSLMTRTLASVGYWDDLWPLLRLVIRFTFAVELIGALLLFILWQPDMGVWQGSYTAIFHSISAFCNAGFSLWPTSLETYRGDVFVNVVFALLIILGGLGFLVVHELFEAGRRERALSVHSKIALSVSALLLAGGTSLIWILERQ